MLTAAHAPSKGHWSRRHPCLVWAAFFAAMLLMVSRPWQPSTTPPASSLGQIEFSAERAWTHVDMLATKLGRRVTGTEPAARAADYIESQLRSLGVESVRQVASGRLRLDATTYVYHRVQNVLARVPGTSARAILVSVHYDSGVEGPGAGDNALNVAAALEIVRATAAGGVPLNTMIFNFNEGEELGLLGAAAFMEHPWSRDVAAFINLDASGPSGRQLLLQVTPGHDDLLEAYAASARYPHGTVLAQEIFQALPLDTDYHVYREAGLGGIDLAPYGDGYAYHTSLDRTERLSPRTLQESGENILALLRGLNALPPARRDGTLTPATYYDLLGLVMVRYSAGTARVLGFLAGAMALLLACSVGAGVRRAPSIVVVIGAAAVALSASLAIVLPVLGSALVTIGGHSMFWYARPWTALLVYGALAAAGVLAGQAVLRRLASRRGLPPNASAGAWRRGLVVLWALLLLTATAMRLGSAYLPLWWCVGTMLALVASTHLDGARGWALTLAGMTLAAITTMEASNLLLTSMVPFTGLLGAEAPAEQLIAALTALAVAPFVLLAAPEIQAPALAPTRRHVVRGRRDGVGCRRRVLVSLHTGAPQARIPRRPRYPGKAELMPSSKRWIEDRLSQFETPRSTARSGGPCRRLSG